jgi:hypothetical protein
MRLGIRGEAKTMRTTSAILTMLGVLLGASLAAAQTVERIDILQSGLYTAAVTGNVATPGTATGNSHTVGNVQFYQSTDRVPARLGTRFGVNYVIVGNPDGAILEFRQIWRLPAPGLRNPKTGNVYRESPRTVQKTIGDRGALTGYSFDDDWEMVPGPWTCELWLGERLMLTKTFTVYKP